MKIVSKWPLYMNKLTAWTQISTKAFPQKLVMPSSPWQHLVSIPKCVGFSISIHCPIKLHHSSQNKATAVGWIEKHIFWFWISETSLWVLHPCQCFQPAKSEEPFQAILWELSAVSISSRHTCELGTSTVLLYSQLTKPVKFTRACFQ